VALQKVALMRELEYLRRPATYRCRNITAVIEREEEDAHGGGKPGPLTHLAREEIVCQRRQAKDR